MKKIETYQCEICGGQYDCPQAALFCEMQPLPICPVKPGDKVEVYERYDNPRTDEVVSVTLKSSGFYYVARLRMQNADDAVSWKDSLQTRDMTLHTWIIKVKNQHMMGKDNETITDEVDWSRVRLLGAEQWLNGAECEL